MDFPTYCCPEALRHLALSNSHHCHQPPGYALLCPIAEEQVGVAGRAWGGGVDVLRGDAGIDDLPPVGFHQVEEDSDRQLAVSGCARGQEKHRIFLPDGIGLIHFVEELIGIGELHAELVADFLADLVAATLHARADGSDKVPRIAAEVTPHLANTFFDYALDGPAPASVKNSDGAILLVHDDHGQTIGRLHGEEESGGIGDQSVPGEEMVGEPVNTMDEV